MKFRLAGVNRQSIVDGIGIRYTVYMQGCKHKCLGCHNKGTHDMNGGTLTDTEDIIKDFKQQSYLTGISLSGGDPFFQPESATELAQEVHKLGKNVWCYTGYTLEEILKDGTKAQKELLKNIDILVDGRYDIKLNSLSVPFRGSSNQRLIDVRETLNQNKVVEVIL